LSDDGTLFELKLEFAADRFYGKCSAQDVDFARSQVVPYLPVSVMDVIDLPVSLTRFRSFRCIYILLLQDRAIPVQHQRRASVFCSPVYSIDSDHSPFFSAPDLLINTFLAIAQLKFA